MKRDTTCPECHGETEYAGQKNTFQCFFCGCTFKTSDPTEDIRRTMIATGYPEEQAEFAERHWDTQELQRDFIVHSFLAPYVFVTRKADGLKGSMMFRHSPRSYFRFVPGE